MNIPTAKAISQTRAAQERSKLTGSLLYPWQYDREYVDPENIASLVKTFRGWVAVYAAQNARAVASVPLRLYSGKNSRSAKMLRPTKSVDVRRLKYLKGVNGITHITTKAVEIVEVVEHPFIELMRRMNDFYNYYDTMMLSNESLEIAGNAFWYLPMDSQDVPFEVWIVPAQYMRVVPDENDFVKGYLFDNGVRKIAYTADEIIHFKDANINNMYYGIGKVAPISDAYNIMRNMDKYANAMFSNMGRPGGLLSTNQPIPSMEERKRILREWNEVYGGPNNAGKTALTTDGVQYQVIGSTPKEMAFAEGRPLNKEQIAEAFGHSAAMTEPSSLASAEVATTMYMRDTILPQLRLIQDKLNEKLIPKYGDPSLFCAFDDPVPGNREQDRRDRQVNVTLGITSRDEEREEMGMDQVGGAMSDYYVNAGLVPIGSTSENENIIDNGDKKHYIDTMARSIADKVKTDYGY